MIQKTEIMHILGKNIGASQLIELAQLNYLKLNSNKSETRYSFDC